MSNEHILKILEQRGIIHEEQSGFRELVKGIGEDKRVVCAEFKGKRGYSGISFWLYGEGQNWYIGLWSGIYFNITDVSFIEQIILELFSGVVPRGKVPFNLPAEFVKKYKLTKMQENTP